jgi:predicted ATPase
MYVDEIRIENFRTFRRAQIELLHPDRSPAELKRTFGVDVLYPNINLVLGNNGLGKSAFLKALGLCCLGPTVGDAGIFPYRFVRREPGMADVPTEVKRRLKVSKPRFGPSTRARLEARLVPHDQDGVRPSIQRIESHVRIERRGDVESLAFALPAKREWDRIFSDDNDAFFCAGYGANRRTEERESFDPGARRRAGTARAQRLRSIFEEQATLVPLAAWLPALAARNKGRYSQVVSLLRAITGANHYRFTGELEKGEYLFEKDGQLVPFPALSDGYRAFFGWLGDLLYHVCMTAPSGKKLNENRGLILIDEIDLHLHPSWQIEVLPRLSQELPNIQFIVTSHSPLIVGSLQWLNLIVLELEEGASRLVRKEIPVHGLDADQVLVTPFFDLGTTRAGGKARHLRELRNKAREGDRAAALQLMDSMSRGDDTPDPARPRASKRKKAR